MVAGHPIETRGRIKITNLIIVNWNLITQLLRLTLYSAVFKLVIPENNMNTELTKLT